MGLQIRQIPVATALWYAVERFYDVEDSYGREAEFFRRFNVYGALRRLVGFQVGLGNVVGEYSHV